MPQLQEMLAVAAQLAGHLGGGLAGRDAVEDQHQLRRSAVCPLQGRAGPGIEDAATVAALVVEHRLAVAVVDPQALPLTAGRAGQAVGVEHRDEFAVAGVFVQVVDQGEIHDRALAVNSGIPSRRTPSEQAVKTPGTDLAP